MRLQADDAVHHLRTDRLQALGPVDVGLLVEACLQLHDRHHLLAAPRRLEQQVHQDRLRAGAVDGLLDRQHIGVVHRLAQQLHHRLEALEGVVHQHVTLAQALEHRTLRALAARQALRPGPLVGREAQVVGIGLIDQLVQPHQVHRPVDVVERGVGQAELLQKELAQFLGAGGHHLEPDRLAEVARRQRGTQRLAQVDHVVVDVEVGVARHAELRKGLDGAAGEQFLEVGADHAGQHHESLPPGRQRLGQADHARQHAWHLHDGDRVVAPEGVAPAELDDEVERLVRHLREGVGRIQADRHQQRSHLALEEAVDPAALRGVALGMVEHHDALALQGRHHHLVEGGVLRVDQRVGRGGHLRHLARGDARAGQSRGLQVVGETHFEELVHVGRDDAHIAQPLQQRHILTQGLGQHAAVEFQDGLLTVEQRRGRRDQRLDGGLREGAHFQSL